MQTEVPPPGVEERRRLAWYQKTVLWLAWLGALIGPPAWIISETLRRPDRPPGLAPMIVMPAALLAAVALTVVVRKAPAGAIGHDIASVEGLRGPFRVRSDIARIFAVIFGLAAIGATALLVAARGKGAPIEPAHFAIAPLIFAFVALGPRLLPWTTAFTIDDHGRMLIRRRGRSRPLDLERCGEIRLRLHRGEGGRRGMTTLACDSDDLGLVRFELSSWRSELYGSHVDSDLLIEWFRRRAAALGFSFEPLGPGGRDGWVAARQPARPV